MRHEKCCRESKRPKCNVSLELRWNRSMFAHLKGYMHRLKSEQALPLHRQYLYIIFFVVPLPYLAHRFARFVASILSHRDDIRGDCCECYLNNILRESKSRFNLTNSSWNFFPSPASSFREILSAFGAYSAKSIFQLSTLISKDVFLKMYVPIGNIGK